MFGFSKRLSTALCFSLLVAVGADSFFFPEAQAASRQEAKPQADKADKKARRQQKRAQKSGSKKSGEKKSGEKKSDAEKNGQAGRSALPVDGAAGGEIVEVVADRQSKNGDVFIYEGYVNATVGEMRLQADRVTFNNVTGDMVAEGNVIFDEGADQRVTARRAEINWTSRQGTFWDTTGFTNRTQTGDYVFFTAARVEKTGPDTYELFGAKVTACEDVVPKWSFNSNRAELKMGDRVTIHNSVFRIKNLPVFVLPYAWIPATRKERKSGFLLPTTGTSNSKGRTLKLAYYQTLGDSADITFRTDVYTQRGLGLGAEFRAQTDERSYMRLGAFTVKDRLFGAAGEDQGGTAFVGEGVQYLPHGWLAVGNVSLVSSLKFRQVFSDDISQVIDPRRESTFYANNNTANFSFNFLASNETTTLFRPSRNLQNPDPELPSNTGTNFDIKIRQAPQVDLTIYPRRVVESLPVYLSFDASLGALKREEVVDGSTTLATPAAVQRFDFQPKITVPLATVAGVAITPSLTLRETFYTSGVDPSVPVFDPDRFTVNAIDPRLNPNHPEFKPGLKLFDRNQLDPITTENASRRYAELAVEVRPPSLEKTFLAADGSARFKHLIEPQITYRLIGGIGGEFDRIIKFDERDAVANTNEFEYSITNRFFTTRRDSDLGRKRRKQRRRNAQPSEMKPVRPKDVKGKQQSGDDKPGEAKPEPPAEQASAPSAPAEPKAGAPAEVKPEPKAGDEPKAEGSQSAEKKPKLEAGEQAEFGDKNGRKKKREPLVGEQEGGDREDSGERATAEPAAAAGNQDAPAQPYELVTIKVAQKYFFDRDFGGALVEGRRNQFYPINTLSGFTFGGHARSFSPVNVQVRYRPLSSVYADLRMDVGADDGAVRNLAVGGGLRKEKLSVSLSYYLSRRIELEPDRFEAGTFPGNQIGATIQFGDEARGLYGGTRIGYDFTDRLVSATEVSSGRLRNSRSYLGYGWDCCGVQFNYNTFKAGLRNESAFSVTFTLAGIGSFGSDQFSQLGGGRGGRKRGKKNRNRNAEDDDFP
jgi:hypothetical protein